MNRVRKQLHLDAAYRMGLSGRGVRVCVLDTGVFLHRDLAHRVVEFVDFTKNQTGSCYDDSGHGTHVCGILAGDGAASGGLYQGVAPKAELIAGKVLDRRGRGEMESLFLAFDWILANRDDYGIDIVNISVGIPEKENPQENVEIRMKLSRYTELLWQSNVVVVSAAGNFGPGLNSLSVLGESVDTICVGCYDGDYLVHGKKSCESYSGRGPGRYAMKKPDVVAPGTGIVSCSNRGRSRYAVKSGTSMACPLVSGIAALLLEQDRSRSAADIMKKIRDGAVDLGKPWYQQGYGMVDAKAVFG